MTSQNTLLYHQGESIFGELKLRSDFLCAQKRKFEDREFLFPKNIDWYLSYMYGNYMEIPPEDKREYHVVYQLKI